jgi:predicted molibdopterin-dependent oxidoreductase YjgC
VVQVEGEPHFQASCGTEVQEGMVVTTDSEEIQQTRSCSNSSSRNTMVTALPPVN